MDARFSLLRSRLSAITDAAEARALAFLLLEEEFGVPSIDVYTDKVKQFSADEEARFEAMVRRLEAGEPIQYVLGMATFCGRRFSVSPAVLIPRPETEELAAWVLADCADFRGRLVDGGTGSGCLAVTLALGLPGANVEGWDVSTAALEIAARNARLLGARVRFREMNLLAPTELLHPADIVVSNPPYVRELERAEMSSRVLDHEPEMALFVPDDDALRFYDALARLGAGCVYCEINEYLGAPTRTLFERYGYTATLRQDAYGKDRMIKAVRA